MDRQDVLKRLLYPKCKSAIEFKFDNLMANPLLSYITIQDIAQLNKIASSVKYASKPKEKYALIDNIMTNRGFRKMASGTNRVTYRCLNDYGIVIKIAIDSVGLSDNGNEFRNQHLLKPFVTKCFEVSPCGTVGLFERVVPITSREEFVNISDDIFDLINNLIGKYVLEDIGEKYYMNYGLREGFGPVLLDYPYVFELDGRKLICNVPEPLEPKGYCGGEIDYDIGYNDLKCKKCGKRYLATDLKSDVNSSEKPKIIIEGDDTIMKCRLVRGDEVISDLNNKNHVSTSTIKSKKDFVKLKAKLAEAPEEKKSENTRPQIKKRDEVQLRARLRGYRISKDIDKEFRDREERLARNSETIPVSFERFEAEPVKPKEESHFKASLPSNVVEVIEKEHENVIDPEPQLVKVKIDGSNIYAIIKDNGEIWDGSTNELIGYTVKETHRIVDEALTSLKEDSSNDSEIETPNEESVSEEVDTEAKLSDVNSVEEETISTKIEGKPDPEIHIYAKSESSGTTIGDLVGDKLAAFKGNYKTSDVTSPIDNYFAKKEEPKEIPELIIHPRKNEESKKEDIINEY